jgi:hypothetical protein
MSGGFFQGITLSTIFQAAAFVAIAYATGGASAAYQMAATFAVSVVASRIFAPNVPQAQQNNIRQQVPPDPTAGIPLVYGDAYTGARFCDAVLTSDQQAMYYVMVISCISPNGQFSFDTSKFYYQDQIITFDTTDLTKVISLTDGAGNVDTSINGHLYINLYTSSQSGTITPVNSSNLPSAVMTNANGCPSGQEWPSTGRQMNGLAFAIVKLVYNNNSAGTTSLQPITFHVSHYLNSTGAAKAGDVWYDYLTNTVYGGAVDPSFVDSASATALNTYGDQLITYTPYGGGSASQPRYRFNGVLDTGQTVLSNIDIMMTCCDCWQSYQVVSGKWSVTINQDISPSFTFNDNNIIGNITASELDITQMVNQIEAKFNDSTNRDQAGYVNLQTPANLLYQNEPVNKFTVSYDLVNNSVTAQYLANRTLEQNREDLIVSFSTNYTGIQVNAGDVVTVTNSYYGWSAKQFRVMQVKEVSLPDGSLGAGIQLIEYNSAVYATGDITQYAPAPNSGIASPNYFSALTAPTVTGYPSAVISHFDVSTYVPMVGRVTNGSLYYTTTSTPSASDYKLLTTAQSANSQPVPNNTYYVFANQSLPSGTYYFAYTVASESNTSPLSPLSSAFVWAPVGMSGASGASGASGYSGASGASGASGLSGFSGTSGFSGLSGNSGISANKYAAAYLYQWTTTTPSNPSGTSTYIWATGASSSYTGGGGWSTTVPANSGASGLQLWVASIQVTDVASATTTPVSWSSGFSTYVAGQNGTAVNGVQTARPTVYQWALSIPSISGTSTYIWSTGTYAAPSGWSTSITSAPSAGYTLYAATVPLTDSATATTTTINWTTASIVTAGYAGTNGASSRICYARVPSNPTPISGNITTSGSTSFPSSSQSLSTWGFSATWSESDPNPSSTDTLYQADGIYDPTTNNTVWSTPYISSLKVGSLSAVSTNTGSLTVTGTIQANTAAISGSTLTGSGAVIYSSGVFGIGNSSNNIVYDGSNLNINGGSSINITGQGLFNGQTTGNSSNYGIVSNSLGNSAGGILAYASVYSGSTILSYSAVVGLGTNNNWGGLFSSDTNSAILSSSTGAKPTISANNSGSGGTAIYGYSNYSYGINGTSATSYGVYGQGTYGVYSNGPMATNSTAFVNNLYANYAYILIGQSTGTQMYFYQGPATGSSIATFNASNKPGTLNSTNTWIEVIIGGVSYQIPVWQSN